MSTHTHMHYVAIDLLRLFISDTRAAAAPCLGQQLCADDLAVGLALENARDRVEPQKRLVNVLLLPDLLALEGDGLVEAVELHAGEIVADDGAGRDGASVIQRLLYNVAVLRQDAALVGVAFEVVDRVEDVVAEVPLVKVNVAFGLGLRRLVAATAATAATTSKATGNVANGVTHVANNLAYAVAQLCNDGVEVDGGKGVVL